jgi:putative type II protein secretion system D
MRIRKGIILLVTIGAIFIFITSCTSSTQMNVKTDNGAVNKEFGTVRLQSLGSGLYYDQTTGIVYWWNGVLTIGSQASTTPTPYYSENGKLYRYDPVSSTMEEIE